jgi:hypothetical protein
MIKQIVDFSRGGDGRAAVIEVFMLVEDPQVHIEAIKNPSRRRRYHPIR